MTRYLSERIEAARAALEYYRQHSPRNAADLMETTIDLVADLQHLLGHEAIDAGYLFQVATTVYDTEKPSPYSGWRTRETQVVSFWLGKGGASYDGCLALAAENAAEAAADPSVLNGLWSREDAARFGLARQLQSLVEDAAPLSAPTLYADLLRAALAEVDWHQIASTLLEHL